MGKFDFKNSFSFVGQSPSIKQDVELKIQWNSQSIIDNATQRISARHYFDGKPTIKVYEHVKRR